MSVETLIVQGLEHFALFYTPAAVEKLSFFVYELERWNRRFNLTAKRQVEGVIQELLYDAFFLFTMVKGTASALDMCSGSGILAIPLAILDQTMQLFSVDKTLKKIQFQRHIKRGLALGNVSIIHGRIENLEPLAVDTLVTKGFGSTGVILQKGGRHLKDSGEAYLLKGRTEKAGAYPGFLLERMKQYRLPRSPKEYQLFVYKKVS